MTGDRGRRTTLLMLAVTLWSGPVGAQTRPTVGYIGFLTDDDGPADGAFDIEAALFPTAIPEPDEVALWGENHQDVPIEGGRFFLELGSENRLEPALFENPELWLQFTIDDVEMAERVRLDYVPYSFLSSLAEDALALDGHPAEDFAASAHGHDDLASVEEAVAAVDTAGYVDGPACVEAVAASGLFLRVDGTTALGGNWDVAGNQLLNLVVENAASASAPTTPSAGQLWWDTDASSLNVYDGASWVALGALPGQADIEGLGFVTGAHADTSDLLAADGSVALAGDWDVAGYQLLNLVVENAASDSAPSEPAAGQLWWDTDAEALKVHDGGDWASVGAGVTQGDIEALGFAAGAHTAAPTREDIEALGFVPGSTDLSGLLHSDGSVELVADLNIGGNELLNLVVHNSASDSPPSDPDTGQLWWASDLQSLRVYDGDSWLDLGALPSAEYITSLGFATSPVAFSSLSGTPSREQIPHAGDADTLDGLHAADLESAGSAAAAVGEHLANLDHRHLDEEQLRELVGGGATNLHSHASGADSTQVYGLNSTIQIPPNGRIAQRVQVLGPATPRAFLYLYGSELSPAESSWGTPIGSIVASTPGLTGLSPPDGFVRCDGQVLDDPRSELDGGLIPDLNGVSGPPSFLRGGTTSGESGGSEDHRHTWSSTGVYQTENSGGWPVPANDGARGTTVESHLPPYYNVVWLMKVRQPVAIPARVQIWIDGRDVTAEIGDQNRQGSAHYDLEGNTWGEGLDWETGLLDVSFVTDWSPGGHELELRETGGEGGQVQYGVYFATRSGPTTGFANDSCSTGPEAVSLVGGQVAIRASTDDILGEYRATDDHHSDSCGGEGGVDLVYSVSLAERSSVQVAVDAVFEGRTYLRSSDCEAGELVGCGGSSLTTDELEAGTYYLFVDSDEPDQTGDFILDVSRTSTPLPANDSCASPTTLEFDGAAASVSGTTRYGTNQGSGTCGGDDGVDAVYTFELLTSSGVQVELTADFPALMYLRMTDCEGAIQFDCSTDGSMSFGSLSAGTYYLFVDGVSADDEGDFDITVTKL